MSILTKTGQGDTITEGWRALKLFTDRHEATRLFSSYLNDDPPRERILFFHGDGGNGKTLLLRFLREHCCKRLAREDWQHVQGTTDEEFIAHVKDAADAEPIPSGLIDFGDQPRGEDRPQEAFSALLMLRRDLARHGLRASFPLYDYACVWYLHKTGRLTGERLRSLFPAEELDVLSELAHAASGTSWGAMGKVFLNIFAKHSREKFTLYMQRRKLDYSQVEEIEAMDPERDLIGRLPVLFAKDLNAAMGIEAAPKRIVLFFDTHEAFWGSQRNLSSGLSFQRDEWLRLLLGELDFAFGIVAVVVGRDRPQWPEASRVAIPEEFIETQLVAHLSEADADDYLQRAGIADAALREAVVAYARVESEQVHPLYLGMCADVVLAANEKGTPLAPDDFRRMPQVAHRESELIDRLIRYVDAEIGYAVKAVEGTRLRASAMPKLICRNTEGRLSATDKPLSLMMRLCGLLLTSLMPIAIKDMRLLAARNRRLSCRRRRKPPKATGKPWRVMRRRWGARQTMLMHISTKGGRSPALASRRVCNGRKSTERSRAIDSLSSLWMKHYAARPMLPLLIVKEAIRFKDSAHCNVLSLSTTRQLIATGKHSLTVKNHCGAHLMMPLPSIARERLFKVSAISMQN